MLCGLILLNIQMVFADTDVLFLEDTVDDVKYYEDNQEIGYLDTMHSIDIVSMNCECTTEGLIATLTVKGTIPAGRVEGYEYSFEILSPSDYGLITILYDTDYHMNSPGGYANYGTPEFTVSENSLIVTIDDLIIDTSTASSMNTYAKYEENESLYIDWIPNKDKEDTDDEDQSAEDDSSSESDGEEDYSETEGELDGEDKIGFNNSKKEGETSVDESPGFSLILAVLAIVGLFSLHSLKRKD